MILVFGSLNIDLVVRVKSLPAPGETVLGPSYDVVAGGKGANLKTRQSQVPDAALGTATLVVLQMEVPVRENWALARRARARGARVLLNAAPAQPLPAEALASLDWLVANEIEIAAIAGAAGHGHEDPRAAGAALAAATGIAVVVTLGSQGAVAYAGGEAWEIGALPVTPVDSTAAGDAFVGTLAAARDAGAALPAALRRASVAGALACLVGGAQPSLPSRAAVDARLKQLAPARKVKAGKVR